MTFKVHWVAPVSWKWTEFTVYLFYLHKNGYSTHSSKSLLFCHVKHTHMLSIGHFLRTEHFMAVWRGCTLPTSWDLMVCRVQPLLLFLLHLCTKETIEKGTMWKSIETLWAWSYMNTTVLRMHKILPVKYFSLALARSSASKYHTVMAYLQRQFEQWVTAIKTRSSECVRWKHLNADLVAKAGWTSWGFRLSDQNSSSRSNLGSMSANWAFPSGKIRRRPPCSWQKETSMKRNLLSIQISSKQQQKN